MRRSDEEDPDATAFDVGGAQTLFQIEKLGPKFRLYIFQKVVLTFFFVLSPHFQSRVELSSVKIWFLHLQDQRIFDFIYHHICMIS